MLCRSFFNWILLGSGLWLISTLRLFALLCLCIFILLHQNDLAHSAETGPANSVKELDDANASDDQQMLIEADELNYDAEEDIVSAEGNIQIYYRGYTLQANRVTLNQKTARLSAEGNVRLTEPDGNVVLAHTLDLSEDFRRGFVNSLRVESSLRTRFAAERAEKVDENTTIFHKGVYTACASCVNNPDKPPTWQIKAKTITHNRKTKTIKYKKAKLEFWGVPIFYTPYLSHPDPTVSRKTGFLAPDFVINDDLGIGTRLRYFWAAKPNFDVLVSASGFSRQGVLAEGSIRHKTESGTYRLGLGGIVQQDPGAFDQTSGNNTHRGYFRTSGRFEINRRWAWGWDGLALSDQSFLNDYRVDGGSDSFNSNIFLNGKGDRSSFNVSANYFNIQREDDPTAANPLIQAGVQSQLQDKQPIVHPALNYSRVFDNLPTGGELNVDFNLVSVSREQTDVIDFVDPITPDRYLGVEGTHARASAVFSWRRQFINKFGQLLIPFAGLRSDVFAIGDTDPNVTTLSQRQAIMRVTPTVGIEATWPFVSYHSWGNQVIEPIAQIVFRPSESVVGEVPNEDSHSLVFDDSNLFQPNKFSGFDRAEGGTRLNLGLRYNASTSYGHFRTIVGRSIHVAGNNSFAANGLTSAGAESGLETDFSDYIAGTYFDTGLGVRFSAKARLDSEGFFFKRAELRGTLLAGPFLTSGAFTFLHKQPLLGIDSNRGELLWSGATRISENWRAFGSMRYDTQGRTFVRDSFGLAYDDESLTASVALSEDRSRNDGDQVDRTVYFRLGLRTIGDSGFRSNIDSR